MRLQELAVKRTKLIKRIAQQRNDIEMLAHSFERPLSFFDKGYAFMHKIRQQPKTLMTGALIFAFIFRKSAYRASAGLLPIARLFLFKK